MRLIAGDGCFDIRGGEGGSASKECLTACEGEEAAHDTRADGVEGLEDVLGEGGWEGVVVWEGGVNDIVPDGLCDDFKLSRSGGEDVEDFEAGEDGVGDGFVITGENPVDV